MIEKITVRHRGRKIFLKFRLGSFERKHILDEICFSQNYFPKISREQDFKIEKGDTVIDIGAHVGIFSALAAKLAKNGKVYSFEPFRKNFIRLNYHREINKLGNLIIENKGVSDKNKKSKIYLIEKNTGGHSTNINKFKYLNEKVVSSDVIQCISLKYIFDKYKIRKCNFLKLDCEGEEYKILSALPGKYFKMIDKIVLEFHPVVNELKLAEYLIKRGYYITIYNYGYVIGMIFAKKAPAKAIKRRRIFHK